MTIPHVCVVTPTYNRAQSLCRLLDALETQAPVPGGFEVIVVDDGSSDTTRDVIASHLQVRGITQENKGPAAARNRGWRATKAPVIAFTDDDTVPTPTWLMELVDELESQNVDALGGAVAPLEMNPVSRFVEVDALINHSIDSDGSVRYLITANLAIQRSALVEVNGFDESFPGAAGEDVDLTRRLRIAGFETAVTQRGKVFHEHPTKWREVFKIFERHGRNRSILTQRHPDQSLQVASEWKRLDPRLRYRRYRAEQVGRSRSFQYVICRYVGLGIALWASRRARSTR